MDMEMCVIGIARHLITLNNLQHFESRIKVSGATYHQLLVHLLSSLERPHFDGTFICLCPYQHPSNIDVRTDAHCARPRSSIPDFLLLFSV